MTVRLATQFILILLAWGSTWIVIKDQLAVVNPSWSIAYRFALGGLALLAWCAIRRQPIRFPGRQIPFVFAIGLTLFTLNFNFIYRAEQHIPSGIPAVAFAMLMVPNAVLAWVFLKRGVTQRFIWGAILGISGVALLFAQQLSLPGGSTETALGLGFTVIGLLAASVANVMQASPRALTLPPLAALGWAMLMGAGLNILLALVVAGPPQWDPRPQYLAGLLFLSLFASSLAFALYFDLIRRIGPAEAAWVNVLVPVIAMSLSTIFEDYRWTWMSATGALLTVSGLAMALGRPPRRLLAKDQA